MALKAFQSISCSQNVKSFQLWGSLDPEKHFYKATQNFNSADFINDLLSIDWNGIVNNNDDVNLIVEQWTSSFSLILEKHAPLRERRVSEKFCPWLTKDLKLLSAARDKLKKQAVRSNSEILMQAHRLMRNKVNKLNTESKCQYFSNTIASHNGDLKNIWKTINLVLNEKSLTTQSHPLMIMESRFTTNKAIAESMNDFFCNIKTPFLKIGSLLTSIICGLNFKL